MGLHDVCREFAFTPSANSKVGHFNTYKVDGGSEATVGTKKYTLQVGDYLLTDGNLLPKSTALTEEQKANIAAIVFAVGRNSSDNSEYPEGLSTVHGYAVALQDATSSYCMWSVYSTALVSDGRKRQHPEQFRQSRHRLERL